jgi:hypothetical protein
MRRFLSHLGIGSSHISQTRIRTNLVRAQVERLESREVPARLVALGLGANANTLYRFDSATPGTVTSTPVTGLGETTLVGIDYRPRTGQLIGIGVNGNSVTTYRIDLVSGVATVVGSATVNSISGATAFGVDFNPTVDRIRVVNNLASDGAGANVNNFRLNPNDGSLTAVDPDLDFAGMPGGAANAPEIAVAYTNSFDNQGGATTLHGLVSGGDRLVINGGAGPGFPSLQNVGNLLVDISNNAGLTITGADNSAFAVLEVAGVSGLYTVNLQSGLATLVANVGDGSVDFGGLAAVPQSFSVVGQEAGGPAGVVVRDPFTGREIFNLDPYPGFAGAIHVAMGDVNRDGQPDIVTGAGPGGGPHVRVFNGLNGRVLFEFLAYDAAFTGGIYVSVGDVNRDGFGDIITGPDFGGGPHVRAFSGANGQDIINFLAYGATFTGGVRVASFDLNNDGFDEIVTGAGFGGGPHVRTFGASDGSTFTGVATQVAGPLGSFFAYSAQFLGGIYVTAGDVNGDGIPDIVTGAGATGGPHVRAFSGANGSVFTEFLAYDADFLGGVRVGVYDFNADGRFEIATVSGLGKPAQIKAFDGITGVSFPDATFIQFRSDGLFIGGARF